jgi:hypothetical protein
MSILKKAVLPILFLPFLTFGGVFSVNLAKAAVFGGLDPQQAIFLANEAYLTSQDLATTEALANEFSPVQNTLGDKQRILDRRAADWDNWSAWYKSAYPGCADRYIASNNFNADQCVTNLYGEELDDSSFWGGGGNRGRDDRRDVRGDQGSDRDRDRRDVRGNQGPDRDRDRRDVRGNQGRDRDRDRRDVKGRPGPNRDRRDVRDNHGPNRDRRDVKGKPGPHRDRRDKGKKGDNRDRRDDDRRDDRDRRDNDRNPRR